MPFGPVRRDDSSVLRGIDLPRGSDIRWDTSMVTTRMTKMLRYVPPWREAWPERPPECWRPKRQRYRQMVVATTTGMKTNTTNPPVQSKIAAHSPAEIPSSSSDPPSPSEETRTPHPPKRPTTPELIPNDAATGTVGDGGRGVGDGMEGLDCKDNERRRRKE